MNNLFQQLTVRFIKENHLYDKNDEEQILALIKIKTALHKPKSGYVVRILYNECMKNIFHRKKTIGDFESFLFIQLFNKTPIEILDEYLINNDLYDLFYKTIKALDETLNLRCGVGNAIDGSFFWDATKEGFEFWENEANKLKEYIHNIIFEKIQ